jgi:hypothetical protein
MLVQSADALFFSISRSLHRPVLSLGRPPALSGGNSQRQITAKVRALSKAALKRSPLISDYPGEVSFGAVKNLFGATDWDAPTETTKRRYDRLGSCVCIQRPSEPGLECGGQGDLKPPGQPSDFSRQAGLFTDM